MIVFIVFGDSWLSFYGFCDYWMGSYEILDFFLMEILGFIFFYDILG